MATPRQGFLNVEGLGDKRLSQVLRDLPRQVINPAMSSAMREGFKITHRAVLAAAPVRSGRMKRAIKLRKANHFRDGLGFRIFLPRRIELGAPAIKRPGSRGGDPKGGGYYPAAVEFGYTRRGPSARREGFVTGTDKRGRPYTRARVWRDAGPAVKVAPRSFMRSALHSTASAVQTRIRRAAWVNIREELRKRVPQGGGA